MSWPGRETRVGRTLEGREGGERGGDRALAGPAPGGGHGAPCRIWARGSEAAQEREWGRGRAGALASQPLGRHGAVASCTPRRPAHRRAVRKERAALSASPICARPVCRLRCYLPADRPQLGGYAFIGEGIPVGLGAAFTSAYKKVRGLS